MRPASCAIFLHFLEKLSPFPELFRLRHGTKCEFCLHGHSGSDGSTQIVTQSGGNSGKKTAASTRRPPDTGCCFAGSSFHLHIPAPRRIVYRGVRHPYGPGKVFTHYPPSRHRPGRGNASQTGRSGPCRCCRPDRIGQTLSLRAEAGPAGAHLQGRSISLTGTSSFSGDVPVFCMIAPYSQSALFHNVLCQQPGPVHTRAADQPFCHRFCGKAGIRNHQLVPMSRRMGRFYLIRSREAKVTILVALGICRAFFKKIICACRTGPPGSISPCRGR